MTTKQALIQFLRDNGCFKEFKTNLGKFRKQSIGRYIDGVLPVRYIELAFDWRKARESHESWEKIDLKWRKIAKDLPIEHVAKTGGFIGDCVNDLGHCTTKYNPVD